MDKHTVGVLVADIKGYSLLSDVQLQIFHDRIMSRLAANLRGHEREYSNTWGDALIVAGGSLRELSNLALDIRDFFKNYDWQSSGLPLLDVRISLHVGELRRGLDPFSDGPTIYGRTVVLAARIEPIVLPGQVWVTEQAASLIRASHDDEAPRFGLDGIGNLTLAKGYGSQELFLLRRFHEPKLEETTRTKIVDENVRRASDGPSGLSERDTRSYRAVVGVVIHDGKVVLVRRKPNTEGLKWMFPSGVVLPLQDPEHRVWREVRTETGLSCRVVAKIGERDHPTTRVRCEYFLLSPVDGTRLVNGDAAENEDVQWIPVKEAPGYVGEHLFEPVGKMLKAARDSKRTGVA